MLTSTPSRRATAVQGRHRAVPGRGTARPVADVQAGPGQDRFAGWALIVAYRDNTQPIRRLNVFDGLGTVDATHTLSTPIAPFHTPATGRVGDEGWARRLRGRRGLATETATFNGIALTDALNPANNADELDDRGRRTCLAAKNPDYSTSSASTSTSSRTARARWPTTRPRRHSPSVDAGLLHAVGLLPRLRRGPGPRHGAGRPARRRRRRPRRPGAERRPGTGTAPDAHLLVSVAALRRRRGELPRHRRRHRDDYTRPPPTSADGARAVTATNDAGTSAPAVSAPTATASCRRRTRRRRSWPARPPRAAALRRSTGTWSAPAGELQLPVAALRRRGRELRDIPGATAETTRRPPRTWPAPCARRSPRPTTRHGPPRTTVPSSACATAASDPNDVSAIGNLTAETSCQQLVGGAKYRRVTLPRRRHGARARLHQRPGPERLAAAPDHGGHRRQGQERALHPSTASRSPRRGGARFPAALNAAPSSARSACTR